MLSVFARRCIRKAASREPGTLGAPASCRLGAGYGGSGRQGEFLKPRYFAESSRLEGGAPKGSHPKRFRFAESYPARAPE